MTNEQKVALVKEAWEEYGLARALAAVDLPKSVWYYHRNQKVSYADKYDYLLPDLEEIARQHPEYGWPRVTVELRETYGHRVNHKVVQRLLNLGDLRLIRSTHRPKPSKIRQAIQAAGDRANLVAHLSEIGLFQVMYTDFTELPFANGSRRAYLIAIIGHVGKMAYGWAVGRSTDTALALQAWDQAKATLRPLGVCYAGMIMHHDQGSAFISYEWTSQLLLEDKVRLSYALRGAKDNPEMESFNGHFKNESLSLFLDAQTLDELVAVVDERMRYYNTERRHSSTGYLAPVAYIQSLRPDLETVC
jgi:transposase InsO family protein